MKKLLFILVLCAIGAAATEVVSAYWLYRHYATLGVSFRPVGSSAYLLLNRVYEKYIEGYRAPQVRADHGPVFGPDPILGYSMYPGNYEITEKYKGELHVFHMSVNDMRRRVSSYEPIHASRRIYITGDSAIFGWGLNDQETIPWLLQERIPNYEVVNLTLTSYSTVHALLQLQAAAATINSDDIVILLYHPISNAFNVVAPEILTSLADGYEWQLGNDHEIAQSAIPFGTVDMHDNFSVRRIKLACARDSSAADCNHPALQETEVRKVTEHAFDKIIDLHAGRLIVAFVGGPDNDPVIDHLRSRNVTIADVRTGAGGPDANDVIPTDFHAGAFIQHDLYLRLLAALQREHMIELPPL